VHGTTSHRPYALRSHRKTLCEVTIPHCEVPEALETRGRTKLVSLLCCEDRAPAGLHGQGAGGVGTSPCATLLPLWFPPWALKHRSLSTRDLWSPQIANTNATHSFFIGFIFRSLQVKNERLLKTGELWTQTGAHSLQGYWQH